jgi:hypothetical protein
MVNLEQLELIETPQKLYDSFNDFILSNDTKLFNKLLTRGLMYNKVKDIPGDIVECGVFKGSGFYTFLKLKRALNPNTSKKVIGFDFFDNESLVSTLDNEIDKSSMDSLFKDRNFKHTEDFKNILYSNIIKNGFLPHEFELVKGDVSITTSEFVKENPGFKISLLYMDLDLDIPTYNTLCNFWDNMTKGGIILFDEYGYHKWSESKGVDRFIEERGLKIKSLNYLCPTAYIVKK